MTTPSDVFEALAEARRSGRVVVMGTTVRTEGDPPSAAGNRALFADDGALVAGTIGCNGLDRRAGQDGRSLLAAGAPSAMRSYTSLQGAPGAGGVGGFLEAFTTGRARLVVGGRGPVAEALERLGMIVGLAVRTEPEIGSRALAEAAAGLGPGDAVVFVDHDDPALVGALTTVLRGAAGYVGVMGSRRHTPGFAGELRRAGLDLGRVRSPTGLDIGARVPPEIALAVLAEILAVTRGRHGGPLSIL